MGSFDIRNALTGRNYVTATVPIWLEDKVFYDLDEVRHQHAEITEADDPRLVEIEERLAELERERDASAYTLHLRAISNRSNEDILSKALAAFPIKRDVYGREDEEQQMERGKLIRELQMAAHMTKIVNPEGEAMHLDDDNRRDVARTIIENAPPVTLAIIDEAIKELNKQFQMEQQAQKNVDFLSKH